MSEQAAIAQSDATGVNTRSDLLLRLKKEVWNHDFIHAAWLEGADARGCADAFSDIDLWLDVKAGQEEEALQQVREVVASFGPLTLDEDPGHPHPQLRQRFYGSSNLSPFHFVDVCVQTHGRQVTFTAADPYLLWFDRAGVIRQGSTPPIDVSAELERLLARRWRAVLVEKELRRGHLLEALAYYRNEVLPVLVRVLRLRHSPAKWDYGLKHIHHDLPPGTVERLLKLHALGTPAELRVGLQEIQVWLAQVAEEIRGNPDKNSG